MKEKKTPKEKKFFTVVDLFLERGLEPSEEMVMAVEEDGERARELIGRTMQAMSASSGTNIIESLIRTHLCRRNRGV